MTDNDNGPKQSDVPDGVAVKATRRRALVSGVFSDTIEYYDFAMYGLLAATLFPRLFFSELGDTAALLASFATFGVGFISRPIGAIVFSHLGDKYGRKPVLVWTLVIMGACSMGIGLLPAGQGVLVASVLVVFRLLQGFSLGGEATGNQLLVVEHSAPANRGFMGAIIKTGAASSQVLATLSLAILTAVLTTEQFESWGWRIPFLASLVIVAGALFIRLRLEETPAFKATQSEIGKGEYVPEERRGFRALQGHAREVFWLILCWSGTTISFYLVTVFGVSFITGEMGHSRNETFVILAIANGVSVIACLAGGYISDRIGRKPVSYIGLAGCFIGVGLLFAAPISNSILAIGCVVTLSLCSVQLLSGAWPSFFAEQLPTEVRFSGGALALTVPNVALSATAPFVATALVSAGAPQLIAVFALIVIAVSAFAFSKLPERRGVPLEDVHTNSTDVRSATSREPETLS